jgi:hypothetical protein
MDQLPPAILSRPGPSKQTLLCGLCRCSAGRATAGAVWGTTGRTRRRASSASRATSAWAAPIATPALRHQGATSRPDRAVARTRRSARWDTCAPGEEMLGGDGRVSYDADHGGGDAPQQNALCAPLCMSSITLRKPLPARPSLHPCRAYESRSSARLVNSSLAHWQGTPGQGAVRHAGHVLSEGCRQGPLLSR